MVTTLLLGCLGLTQGACPSTQGSEPHEKIAPAEAPPVSLEAALQGGFSEVTSIEALDSAVRDELRSHIPERIAALGERYQASDMVMEELPWRRFVVAGVSKLSPKFWVVCYEHGGFGHHHHLALFELENGTAVVQKAGQWLPPRRPPVTLERAVEALRKDEQHLNNHW